MAEGIKSTPLLHATSFMTLITVGAEPAHCAPPDGTLEGMPIEQNRPRHGQAAEKHWRRLDGQSQLPKVIHGVKFTDGIEVTKEPVQTAA